MNDTISLKELSFYKLLVRDYLNESDSLNSLVTAFPKLESFERIIEDKFMPAAQRLILSNTLTDQYEGLFTKVDPHVRTNINLLKDSRTFTVCTGHQLNIFTGPLYFLIKISQTISLSRQLKKAFPGYNFVPIYWMASEDHDLEEINHINLFGSKYEWSTKQAGAVGRMSTEGITELAEEVAKLFENKQRVNELIKHLSEAYNSSQNLAEATRKLVHLLFKEEEIVVLDADAKSLKTLFMPLMEKEIQEKVVMANTGPVNAILHEKNYHVQVNPREINLFYLKHNVRGRIIEKENNFTIDDESTSWSKEELNAEVQSFPERFSPNAAFRPVYQELILPNLATIGGPGEISYWLQLKETFKAFRVDYPLLIMRNSFSFISRKNLNVLTDSNLEFKDLLQRTEDFIKLSTLKAADFSLAKEEQELKDTFNKILEKVTRIDPNLVGRVHGAIGGIEKQFSQIESKAVKAIKSTNENHLNKLKKIQDAVFPNGALSERSVNFLQLLNFMTWDELKSELLTDDIALKSSLYTITY